MRTSSWLSFSIATVVSTSITMPARADTATIFDPEDTFIFQFFPDRNFGRAVIGGSETVRTANPQGGGGDFLSLMKFDLAGNLPANAVLTSAQLRMRITGTTVDFPLNQNIIFNFYRVINSWVEGSGTDGGNTAFDNGVVEPGSVSWNSREEGSVAWDTAGGDFDAAWLSHEQAYPQADKYSWPLNDPASLAIVQDWLDNPTNNHGFAIDLAPGAGNTDTKIEAFWYSSEETSAGNPGGIPDDERPQLFVVFDVPIGPGVPIASDIATAVEVFWSTSNSVIYQPQFTDDLVSTNWVDLGGNVIGDGGEKAVFDSARSTTNRSYRVLQF